jgi:DNA processing protein
MTETLATIYLKLFHQHSIARARVIQLIKHFQCVKTLLSADCDTLLGLGLKDAQIEALREIARGDRSNAQLTKDLAWLSEDGHHLVCFESELYPSLLREISFPPLLLFVIGRPEALRMPQFAIVGSRNATAGARRNAFWMARELALAGLTICSGFAAGIDTEAHLGALAAGGNTIAVLGTGADIVYPRRNTGLVERIGNDGALISEFPLGSPPLAAHFPQRNRIISGMSVGVLVVEASLKSGSLITAACAMEQNREVFVVPGAINNPEAKGCNRLIQQGARLIDSPQDIVPELESLLHSLTQRYDIPESEGKSEQGDEIVVIKNSCIDRLQQRILDCLGAEACQFEILLKETGAGQQSLNSALLQLEIGGIIEQWGGRFRKVRHCLQDVIS